MTLSAAPRADRRAALFRESLTEKATRWTLGLAWALMPGRISGLPNLARLRPARPRARARQPAGALRHRARSLAADAARRLSARALPARAYRAAEMVVAAAALGFVLQEFPHLEQSAPADAAGSLQRDLRPRFRRRNRGLRRTPPGPLAPVLDHAAHHARLCRGLRCRL